MTDASLAQGSLKRAAGEARLSLERDSPLHAAISATFVTYPRSGTAGVVLNSGRPAAVTFEVALRNNNFSPGETAFAQIPDAEKFRGVMEIRRGGKILVSREFAIESVEQELTIRATREDGVLRMRVGAEALVFRDIALPSRATPGQYGLIWPEGLRLKQLRLEEKLAPPEPALLEQGDAHLSAGEYDRALLAYESVIPSIEDRNDLRQARLRKAICLQNLGREEEAEGVYNVLALSGQNTIAMQATVKLWSMYAKAKRFADSEAFLNQVSQFETSVLMEHSSVSERQAIIGAYFSEGQLASLRHWDYKAWIVKTSPEMNARLKTTANLLPTLLPDGPSLGNFQWRIGRTLLFTGQHEDAYESLKRALESGIQPIRDFLTVADLLRDLGWAARLTGKAEQVLVHLNLHAFADDDRWTSWTAKVLLERARCYVTLEKYEQAATDLQTLIAASDKHHMDYLTYSTAAFLLAETQADPAAKIDAYETGRLRSFVQRKDPNVGAVVINAQNTFRHRGMINAVILEVLSGHKDELSSETIGDLLAEWNGLVSRVAASVQSMSKAFGLEEFEAFARDNPQEFLAIMEASLQSDYGRQCVRHLACADVGLHGFVREPALIYTTVMMNVILGEGKLSPDEQSVIREMAAWVFDGHTAGRLNPVVMGALFFAWQGNPGPFGWEGLKGALPVEILPQVGYALGLRYHRLGQAELAKECLETARDKAPEDSRVRAAAEAALQP